MTKSYVAALATAAAAIAALPAHAQTIPRFGTADVVLHSTATYDAATGSPNPFDLSLTAKITSPTGRTYNVEGFFDGDGYGGARGNVFRLRIYCDTTGTWRWTTTSSVAGLGAKSGSFSCSGTLAGAFATGPVVENPVNRRTVMYQYGKPVFLAAKFLDSAASSNALKFSHTFLSETTSDSTRQSMLDRHRGMSLNKMNVYLANKGDYGIPTTPWKGSASSNDKTRFDLARWRNYDKWILKLRDAGMVADLWYFADDSSFGNLSDPDRQRLIRYAMARLSGFVNTQFVLALEWQEGWSSSEVGNHATFMHSRNPWARMVSVHGTPGDFAFPTASWADFMSIQAGNSASHGTVHASTLRNRGKATKPVIQEEHGLGTEDTRHRQNAWAAFAGGAAGVGTGAYLKHLVTFSKSVTFERLEPRQDLRTGGATAYVLAAPGIAYVAYLPNGGSVSLNLGGMSGALTVRWFDPRNGTWSSSLAVTGGAVRTLAAPSSSADWALVVTGSKM